jgi:hypothetical protein
MQVLDHGKNARIGPLLKMQVLDGSNENKNENHIFLKMGTSPKSSEPRHNFQQMKKTNIVSNLIRALMNWDLSRGGSDA